MGRSAAGMKFCCSSGVCRCTPPTPYALAEPISSAPSRCGLRARPAPTAAGRDDDDVPSVGQPRAMAGSRARVAVVG
jgi:hypothetical protein